jgi:hypothetical protein
MTNPRAPDPQHAQRMEPISHQDLPPEFAALVREHRGLEGILAAAAVLSNAGTLMAESPDIAPQLLAWATKSQTGRTATTRCPNRPSSNFTDLDFWIAILLPRRYAPKELFAMAYCHECHKDRPATHPEAFSTAHKDEETRRRLARLAATPYSTPIAITRKQPAPTPARRPMSLTPSQQEARAAVLADRTPKERAEAALRAGRAALAVPPPTSRTLSLREAREALAAMSAQDSERLNSERENDMHIRAAGLRPHNAELEKRRTAGAVEKRQLPDLTG